MRNELPVETTLHWHGTSYPFNSIAFAKESPTGILQRGTPQMDGVPGVTQVSFFTSVQLRVPGHTDLSTSIPSHLEAISLIASNWTTSTASTGTTRIFALITMMRSGAR